MAAARRKAATSAARRGKGDALSERAQKARVSRLRRRVADLMMAYIATGRATAKLQASAIKLKGDIDRWRDETGRSDLRATRSALRNDGDDDWSCESCEWIMTSMGRLCFLVGCDPEWNNCSYICITIPRDPNYPVN